MTAPTNLASRRPPRRSMTVGQLRRNLRDVLALIAGAVEFVGARLARAVALGQGAGDMTISLAFLAPDLGQSRHGRSPAARDRSCPSLRCPGRVVRQYRMLGLTSPQSAYTLPNAMVRTRAGRTGHPDGSERARSVRGVAGALSACRRPSQRRIWASEKPTVSPHRSRETREQVSRLLRRCDVFRN